MLKLAYRNLWRNRRRTIITLSGIIFAAALISFVRFLQYGTHQETIQQAVGYSSGYMQIAAYGWLEDRTLERALDYDNYIIETLNGYDDEIHTVSPRIESGAMVNHNEYTRFIQVQAADPEKEKSITTLADRIIAGSFLPEERRSARERENQPTIYDAVIGYRLARTLGAEIGSELTLVGSQFDGSIGAILIRVTGILRADHASIDSEYIFINLNAGEVLFAPGDENTIRYTSLALGIEKPGQVDQLYKKLLVDFPIPITDRRPEDSLNYDPVPLRWQDLNQDLLQYMALDDAGNEVIYFFILLIMAFGVLTTVEMSIHERKREFGIMMAIGTRSNTLVIIVMAEVCMLLIIGIGIGLSIGMGFGQYFSINPISLGEGLEETFVDFGSAPVLRSQIYFTGIWLSMLTLALPALFFSYIAARRIHKFEPVQVINTL